MKASLRGVACQSAGAMLAFTLASCSLQGQPHGMPDVGVAEESLNAGVRLTAPEGWNTFKLESAVTLLVEATGDQELIFPPDFGIRAFRYEDGEWIEVASVQTERHRGDVVLATGNGEGLIGEVADIFPVIPDRSKPVTLRIFVIGRVYLPGGELGEGIGAYTDVTLRP